MPVGQDKKEETLDADFLLIRKMKQGEDDAFEVFVRRYYKDILTYCSYHCPDREYAEDITQETFVHFFANLSAYHCRGKTKNYLYTIAGNLCRDYRKRAREIPLEDTDLSGKIKPKEREAEDALDRIAVEWALKQLPEEFCEVIMLYYFQELRLTEIADTLQIGLPLVKYRLRKAKMQLSEMLEEGK